MSNVIKMPKRFDYSASSEFNNLLADIFSKCGDGGVVTLDCVNMDYIDSAGIGLLVMAHKKALSARATITMAFVKQSIKEILMLANLQKLIEIK
ncbi:STAS domain-containing protein [Cellvibrio sp.]|uniref:STAS domain-containing protein n=1 Tax=Cellvibrio sp. TaxID=1965322 RepID=UPI0039648278